MAQVDTGDGVTQLTPRQMEIFGLVAKGLSNRDICELLGISSNTVKIHVAALLKGLGVANRTEAAFVYRDLLGNANGAGSVHAKVADRIGRPAIAVLPFGELDPVAEDHFAEGVVEDLITRLSGWRWFPVIGHSSSGRYPGDVEPSAVRDELGARYVIRGTIRRVPNRVRVNAHLVETDHGEDLWSDSFDVGERDVLAAQDHIARSVVARIAPELMDLEGQLPARSTTGDFDAWRATMSGMWHLARRTAQDVATAQQLFDAAIEREPQFSLAWYGRTWAHHHNLLEQWTSNPLAEIGALRDAATTCLRLDPQGAPGNTVAGLMEMIAGNRDRAVAHLEKAAAMNPSSTQALSLLGQCYGLAGRPDECIAVLEDALRLNPFSPAAWVYYSVIGLAHFAARRYDEAIDWSDQALSRRPEMISAHLTKVAADVERGRLDAARASVASLLTERPDFALGDHMRLISPSAHPDYVERLTQALAQAGLSMAQTPST